MTNYILFSYKTCSNFSLSICT